MVPWISNEAKAVIPLECRCADVILINGSFRFSMCMQINCFKGSIRAFFEDFVLGFNPEVIDFIPPRNEIGRPLVAKLSANFLVSP